MTVSYSLEVATANTATFFKLLFKWRGSIYRCMWVETVVFLVLYFSISFVYRFALNPEQRYTFELVAYFIDRYSSYIPITFLLGFYVSIIITRWWDVFWNIPWPDKVATLLTSYYPGADDNRRTVRRTIVRYLSAASVLTLRGISTVVKKRFPTLKHVQDAGLLTEDEMRKFESMDYFGYNKYFIVTNWCFQLLSKVYHQPHKPISDVHYKHLIDEVNAYKGCLGTLLCYDWVPVPLVYTQVVTIAVYSFFLSCLIGRQYLSPAPENSDKEIDMYFPIFTFLQFTFYVGWLKVAENLINPLGEDDDDFELNWILDRNLRMGYVMTDDLCGDIPELVDDIWKDKHEVPCMPYTVASLGLKDNPLIGSTQDYTVSPEESMSVPGSQNHSRLASRVPSTRRSSGNSPAALLMRKLRQKLGPRSVNPSPLNSPRHIPGTPQSIYNQRKRFGSRLSVTSEVSTASKTYQKNKPAFTNASNGTGHLGGVVDSGASTSVTNSPTSTSNHRTFFGRQYSSPEGDLAHLDNEMTHVHAGGGHGSLSTLNVLSGLQGIAEDDEYDMEKRKDLEVL